MAIKFTRWVLLFAVLGHGLAQAQQQTPGKAEAAIGKSQFGGQAVSNPNQPGDYGIRWGIQRLDSLEQQSNSWGNHFEENL